MGMGSAIGNLFRRQEEGPNMDVARAISIHQTKEKSQIDHERDIGLKHDIIKDGELFTIYNANCYNYAKVNVKIPTENGHFIEKEDLIVGGLNQENIALRAMVSPNNGFRFLTKKDANLFAKQTRSDVIILETQKDIVDATIENFVYNRGIIRQAELTYLDSVDGRKVNAMLRDVKIHRAEVADVSKRKENRY